MALRRALIVCGLALSVAAVQAKDLEAAKAAIRLKEFAAAAKLLSEQTEPAAQYLLATLYLSGLGVPQDQDKGKQLLQAAAEHGEPRAAYALSGLLASQDPPDLVGARTWLERAAQLHFAPAVDLQERNALPMQSRPAESISDAQFRDESLWLAVRRDDVAGVKALCDGQFDKADLFGRTLLHHAVEVDADAVTSWLLAQHAAVDATDQFGVTPLMLAAASDSPALLRELLSAKANVTAVDHAGNNALVYAARANRVAQLDALLAAGGDLHAKNKNAWSAIDFAQQAQAQEADEWLRAHGAEAVRRKAAVAAKRSGEFLRAPNGIPDLYANWSDLAVAISRNDPVLVQSMLDRGGKLQENAPPIGSLLMVATTTQSPKSTAALLAMGVDGRAANSQGATPLVTAITQGDLASARALLAAGVRADLHGNDESAPLVVAIRFDRTALVRELLAAGADANGEEQGATVLMMAAQRGQLVTVQALLAAKASVDAVDKQGRSALWWAAAAKQPNVVAALLGAQAGVDAADELGVTPLLQAAAVGDAAVVELLLAAGANATHQSKRGDTSLLLAAAGGHLDVVKRLVAVKGMLDVQNSGGDTALIVASRSGHADIVTVLLQAGASKKLRNIEKVAAEDVARARGFEALAANIEKH